MARRSVYVLVLDKDAKTYALIGPIGDDTDITYQVSQAKDRGRDVHCETQREAGGLIKRAEESGFRRCDVADMVL
jgi:hypothetical protein